MNNTPRLSTLPKSNLNSAARTFHSIPCTLFHVSSTLFNLILFLSPPTYSLSLREERTQGFHRQIDDLMNDFRAEQWGAHEHALARNQNFNRVPSQAGFPMPSAHGMGVDDEVGLSTSFDNDSGSDSGHEETYVYTRSFLEGNLFARPFIVAMDLRPIIERSPITARHRLPELQDQAGRDIQEQIQQERGEQERRSYVEGWPARWSRFTPSESTYGLLSYAQGLRIWFLDWDNWQKILIHDWERRRPSGDWDFWQRRLSDDELVQEREQIVSEGVSQLMGEDIASLSVPTSEALRRDEERVVAARDGVVLAQELLRLVTGRHERMEAELLRLQQEEQNRRMGELSGSERTDKLNQESEDPLLAVTEVIEDRLRYQQEEDLESELADQLGEEMDGGLELRRH
ncbi:hypothetical protein B7494_g5422 [Chlorociboria aeruginascens]|nr:hypothetical protein B7494_g5422 [Chlorociboria aeruginascens]